MLGGWSHICIIQVPAPLRYIWASIEASRSANIHFIVRTGSQRSKIANSASMYDSLDLSLLDAYIDQKHISIVRIAAEVRNIIYEYCLVVESVYPISGVSSLGLQTDVVHQDAYYYDTPNVSWLETCKQVSWEAEHMYQQNKFVMPTSSLTARFFANTMNTAVRRSWLKSVEIYLDPSDLDTEDRKVICGSRLD